MPFNLIMGRKPFTVVNELCCKYEEKFKEKVATARVVNVLVAEALIARGLIPETYIQEKYGCAHPIEMGFTANARNEKKPLEAQAEKVEFEKKQRMFSNVLKQWQSMNEKARAYWLSKAQEHAELPNAKLVLDLVKERRS